MVNHMALKGRVFLVNSCHGKFLQTIVFQVFSISIRLKLFQILLFQAPLSFKFESFKIISNRTVSSCLEN
jgi:hypothetical protein